MSNSHALAMTAHLPTKLLVFTGLLVWAKDIVGETSDDCPDVRCTVEKGRFELKCLPGNRYANRRFYKGEERVRSRWEPSGWRPRIKGSTLVMTGLRQGDAGTYHCDALDMDTHGQHKFDCVRVFVFPRWEGPDGVEGCLNKYRPVIQLTNEQRKEAMRPKVLLTGDSLALLCEANETMKVEHLWYFNNNSQWRRLWSRSRPEWYASDSLLHLKDLSLADAGQYRCFVQKRGVGGDNITYTVVVVAAKKYKHDDAVLGSAKRLDCPFTTVGNASLRIRWTLDGKQVTAKSGERGWRLMANQSLFKDVVTADDKVVFKCTFRHLRGEHSSTVSLRIAGPPSKVRRLQVNQLTWTLSWKAPSFVGFGLRRYVIELGFLSRDVNLTQRIVVPASTTSLSLADKLAVLLEHRNCDDEHNATVKFTVRAENEDGDAHTETRVILARGKNVLQLQRVWLRIRLKSNRACASSWGQERILSSVASLIDQVCFCCYLNLHPSSLEQSATDHQIRCEESIVDSTSQYVIHMPADVSNIFAAHNAVSRQLENGRLRDMVNGLKTLSFCALQWSRGSEICWRTRIHRRKSPYPVTSSIHVPPKPEPTPAAKVSSSAAQHYRCTHLTTVWLLPTFLLSS